MKRADSKNGLTCHSETRPKSPEDTKSQFPQRVWFGRSVACGRTESDRSYDFPNSQWYLRGAFTRIFWWNSRDYKSATTLFLQRLAKADLTVRAMIRNRCVASARQGSASLFGGLSKKQDPNSDRASISGCSTSPILNSISISKGEGSRPLYTYLFYQLHLFFSF